jgi:hypothetical protein
MRDSQGRNVITPQRRTPSTTDMTLLAKVGAEVDCLLVVNGAIERWRGAIARATSVEQPSIALRPLGAENTTIEFLPEQVRDCAAFDAGARGRDAISTLQALRCGRRVTSAGRNER